MSVQEVTSQHALTPTQRGMLFHATRDGSSRAYFQQLVGELVGVTNITSIIDAWNLTFQRHAAGRISFQWDNMADARQHINADITLPISVDDWRMLDASGSKRLLAAYLRDDRAKGFDLSKAPLLRVFVARRDDDRWLFVWSYHHLLFDGWSVACYLDDVAGTCADLCDGRQPVLQPAAGFDTYLAWWHRQDLSASAKYWRDVLDQCPPSRLGLPPPRYQRTASVRNQFVYTFSRQDRDKLTVLCRRRQVTMQCLIQAAWAILLSRHGAGDDALFAITAAARPTELDDVDTIVGPLASTIPIRVAIQPDEPVSSFLVRFRRCLTTALQHQLVPLARITELVELPRDPDGALIESLVVETLMPLRHGRGSVSIETQQLIEQTGFPLTVDVSRGQPLTITLTFDTARYSRSAVWALLQRYGRIVMNMAEDDAQRVGDLDGLSTIERRRLLLRWGRGVDMPVDMQPFHALFARQVAETPDAIAVVDDDEQLTYAKLDQRAARLAGRLLQRGAMPDDRIALVGDRGCNFLAAMLGVFKAGAAYVPLDPEYPADRLRTILRRSGARIALTADAYGPLMAEILQDMPIDAAPACLSIEASMRDTDQTEQPTLPAVASSSLAYVIYTSGSTGEPKGAMIEHGGMVNHLRAKLRDLALSSDDRVVQSAPQCFDISVWQFLAPLLCGGSVRVVSNSVLHEPDRLLTWLERDEVTVFETVPSFLAVLIDEISTRPGIRRTLPSLRWLLTTGEAVPVSVCRRWLQQMPAVPLMNAYGPTECSDDVTHHVIAVEPPPGQASIPIGRPIINTQLYILDRYHRVAATGVTGELCVGGVGVGRGYLADPQKTADAFVTTQMADVPGRIYRTGDLARYRSDGVIEFLGRIDHQIKLRGFRIELGEIETALDELPNVQAAAVLAMADPPPQTLVAFVVAGPPDGRTGLRQALEKRLPHYMIPSEFVYLDAMPLNQNGKLDRVALAALRRPRVTQGDEPEGPIEQLIAATIAATLGVKAVGRDARFFDLGGDSILAMQLAARLRRVGVSLTPAQIFRHVTVREMAAVCGGDTAPVWQTTASNGTAPTTPIQQWFFEQGLVCSHHFNQAQMLEFISPLPDKLIADAVAIILNRHPALRHRFFTHEGTWQQRESDEQITLQTIDLTGAPKTQQADAMAAHIAQAQSGLDLRSGPITRAVLFRLSQCTQRLLLVAHHLVVDAVSWRILLEELTSACRAIQLGAPIDLPPASPTFSQWAHFLHQRSLPLHELKAWRQIVTAAQPDLPTDAPLALDHDLVAGATQTTAVLDRDVTESLLRAVPASLHTSVNVVLIAALALALRNWVPRSELLIDVEGHGRDLGWDQIDVSHTVGWFTSIFPFVMHLGTGDDISPMLARISAGLASVPSHGSTYGALHYIARDPVLMESPRAELVFNYLGRLDGDGNESGIFRVIDNAEGAVRSDRGQRRHSIELDCWVRDSRLVMRWTFHPQRHFPSTIATLAAAFRDRVTDVVRYASQGYREVDLLPYASSMPTVSTQPWAVHHYGRDIEDTYAATPLQQTMLLRSLLEPEAGLYVQQAIVRLRGSLSAAAMHSAWMTVLRRCPTLRTSFDLAAESGPLQIVHRPNSVPFTVLDWSGQSAEQHERQLQHWLDRDRQQGIDTTQAPAMRVCLIRTAESSHCMIWTLHHAVSDGWSLPVVFDLLSKALGESAAGSVPVNEPGDPPYRGYVEWLAARNLDAARRFWHSELHDLHEPTHVASHLGIACAGQAGDGNPYAFIGTRIDSTVVGQAQRFAAMHGITLSTLLQGALGRLLCRKLETDDVVIGVTFSGRSCDLPEIDRMVGCLINTLPLRIRDDRDVNLADWLRQLQTLVLEIQRFEHTPMSLIREVCAVPKDRPLFDCALVFENYQDADELEQPHWHDDLTVESIEFVESNDLPLTITVYPQRTLRLQVSYDRRLFAPDDIERFLQSLVDEFVALIMPTSSAWPRGVRHATDACSPLRVGV